MIIEIIAGALLGAVFVFIARQQHPRGEAVLYAIGLVVAAIIYAGFAVIGAAPPQWMAIEFAGILPFAAFAWLGVRHSTWWLAAGWLVHPLWDTGFHLFTGTPAFVPSWYPVVCIGFDLLVAGAIAIRMLDRRTVAAGAS